MNYYFLPTCLLFFFLSWGGSKYSPAGFSGRSACVVVSRKQTRHLPASGQQVDSVWSTDPPSSSSFLTPSSRLVSPTNCGFSSFHRSDFMVSKRCNTSFCFLQIFTYILMPGLLLSPNILCMLINKKTWVQSCKYAKFSHTGPGSLIAFIYCGYSLNGTRISFDLIFI